MIARRESQVAMAHQKNAAKDGGATP